MARRKTPNGVPMKWLRDHVNHDADECLIWPFRRNHNGYARINIKRKDFLATRLMCEFRNGLPPTPSHHAAHGCGNGHLGCVNPKHLAWKTVQENIDDKAVHGTNPIGEKNPQSKLTAADVIAIRRIKTMNNRQIARLYGMSRPAISMIRNGINWPHIPHGALG